VENGEVIALLDIAKCLYDAIARMERASEKGKAIAAAVEGVEKIWGTPSSGIFLDNINNINYFINIYYLFYTILNVIHFMIYKTLI
jgi:hypothetical protein